MSAMFERNHLFVICGHTVTDGLEWIYKTRTCKSRICKTRTSTQSQEKKQNKTKFISLMIYYKLWQIILTLYS